MIKESDIEVRDKELRTRNIHFAEAEVTLRASGCIPFEEGLHGIEQMKVRLKQEILYKVYGEILHALREELYDLKYKVTPPMREDEPCTGMYSPYAMGEPIDAAYSRLINLIVEKMKVSQP